MDEQREHHKAYIFGNIFLFSNKLQNLGNRLFKEITMKQWLLLIAIIQSGIHNPTLTDVANMMGYTRQNVKKLALLLEGKGFIQFQKDLKDSRVLRLVITEKCYAYFENRLDKEEEFMEKLYEGITDEEMAHMFLGMKKLEKNLLNLEGKGEWDERE
ncbi:MarR family winged helix-turn-helix transcriptional regulator [Vallitalea okinawensis]|uniref:MarR family winged helix-turn-helix transcriptional regulator n=1 Tax=Vallitalea okinawensis TaxID=2078660 RepID=UPI000CFAA01B|nr:MarR family transcriptional regulator [Vallitalea okinawensis]